METLKFLVERQNDYDSNYFINDVYEASRAFGKYEAIMLNCKYNSIIIPMLHKKEAISSMWLEGTQTTITEVLEDEVNKEKNSDQMIMLEVRNHTRAISYGSDYLRTNDFSHDFIKKLHSIMLDGLGEKEKIKEIGKYKSKDNYIINTAGTVVFYPPSYKLTQKYMTELIDYMNDKNDGINPLIKAAIIHSQFESIHPFENGNGRLGRLLINLYLYKAKVISVPIFYISEVFNEEKTIYYNMLTSSRKLNYNEWISYFLRKCIVQANKHIKYFDDINNLYDKTSEAIKKIINSPKFDEIVKNLFINPYLTSNFLSEKLNISLSQARKYLACLENNRILIGSDRHRNRIFVFDELINLLRQ